MLLFGMVFGCVEPALRQPHIPTIFLYRRKLTHSSPTNCHMSFTYVTHLILIPATQGHRVLKSCDCAVQVLRVCSHIQKVQSNNTRSVKTNSSLYLHFSNILRSVRRSQQHSSKMSSFSLRFFSYHHNYSSTSHILKFTHAKIFFSN